MRGFFRENRGLIADLFAMALFSGFAWGQLWTAKEAAVAIGGVILARTKARGLFLRGRGGSSGDSEPPTAPGGRGGSVAGDEPSEGEVSGLATPFIALSDVVRAASSRPPRPPGGGGSLRPRTRAPMPSGAGE